MSDTLQGALIAGIAALAGVMVTQVGNLILEKRRELTSYRINLYEKRLAAHQEAFAWVQRLKGYLHQASPATDELSAATNRARDWWDGNCLYLDPNSRSEFIRFLGLCMRKARGEKFTREDWEQMDRVEKAVVKGIGEKHIEVSRALEDDDR